MTENSFVANPYRIGGPATGAQFADRERDLQKLVRIMLNGQNLILIAPRRFGKTSILLRAAEQVRAQGGRTGRQSLIRCSDAQEVAEALLRGVLQGPMQGIERYMLEIARRLAAVRVSPEFTIDPESGLPKVKLSPSAGRVEWAEVIAEVVRLLNHVAGEGHRTSLILDEFQKVKEIDPNLPDVFKDMTDDLRHVSLVFAGSKRHLMRQMAYDEKHGALFNVGAVHEMQVIPKKSFVPYLMERAEEGGKSLPEEMADRIYDIAAGVPHDVQLVAYFAFEAAQRVIDDRAYSEALVSAVGDQKSAFRAAFDRIRKAGSQQRMLKLIAKEGRLENPYSKTVLAEIKVTNQGVGKAVESLLQEDLVERDKDGGLKIVRGLFREWLVGDYD